MNLHLRNSVGISIFFLLIIVQTSTAQKAELKVQLGHSKIVYCVAFSPDGKYAASGSADFTYKLWEVESGREIRTVKGHQGYVTSICFSPDGKYLLTGGGSYEFGELKLWDVVTGKLIREFKGHSEYVWSAIFNKNGSQIISGGFDSTIRIWDRNTGKQLKIFSGAKENIRSVRLVPGTNFMVSAGGGISDNELLLWDINSGKIVDSFDTRKANDRIEGMDVSPDGKWMVTAINKKVQCWDLSSRKLKFESEKHSENVDALVFSKDGKYFFSGSFDNTIIKWEVATGKPVTTLKGHKDRVYSLDCSTDGKLLISGGSFDRSLRLWDAGTGNSLKTFSGYNLPVSKLLLSNDGNNLYAAGYDESSGSSKLEKWNLDKSERVTFFSGYYGKITDMQSDTAGKYLITDGPGIYMGAYDLEKMKSDYFKDTSGNGIITCFSPAGKTILTNSPSKETLPGVNIINFSEFLKNNSRYENSSLQVAKFSRDGKYLLLTVEVVDSDDNEGYIYDDVLIRWPDQKIIFTNLKAGKADVEFVPGGQYYIKGLKKFSLADGRPTEELEGSLWNLLDLAVSNDGKYIAGGGGDWGKTELKVWEAATGKLVKEFEGHYAEVTSVVFSADSRLLFSGSSDSQIKIWDLAEKKELATLVSMEEMGNDYVVVTPSGLFDGTPKGIKTILHYTAGLEVIDLEQLKERYYEPGLLRKILGYSNEPLRDVQQLGEVKLYPAVNLKLDKTTGKLNVDLSNRGGGIGRTVIYINGKEVVSDARGGSANPDALTYQVNYNLKNHPYLLSDTMNEVTVKVYNKEGYLVSKGFKVGYRSDASATPAERPSLYILAVGVSDYTNTGIDLKYPSKDAINMEQTLSLGAKRLFGTSKTTSWLLTTESNQSSLQPTRKNIISIFDSIARRAKSTDVLVVYLSGHGINWGGANGDFYYLTKEAYSASVEAYNDPAIRKTATISGAELVELIKKIPALKQVLMIDACASGKAIDNMMAKRDISSGTLKALDRMKDRAGMHIITGCAADAVSYEASRYGQGVLTYSIIESIRGAALRNNRFIDIGLLFQYARDRVPFLAEGIGGIQKPQVLSPYGAQSFDIGEMTSEDVAAVKLSPVKPVFIRSNFQDEVEPEDVLGLSIIVDDAMEDAASSKGDSKLVFWDVREYPDAYKLNGRYLRTGNKIILKLVIKSSTTRQEHQVEAGNKEELVKLILEKVAAIH